MASRTSSSTNSFQLIDNENADEESFGEESASSRWARFTESWSCLESISNDIYKVAEEDLCINEILGQGSYSDVYRATITTKDSDGIRNCSTFAIKKPNEQVITDKKKLETWAEGLAIETSLIKSLEHKNIVSLHGIKQGSIMDQLKSGDFFLVLELVSEDLDCRLARWKKEKAQNIFQRFALDDIIQTRLTDVVIGIANGMEYLHSKNILYR